MNSNAIHNVFNIAIIVLGAVTGVLIATGCTELPTGALECSKSWLNPKWTAIATTGLGTAKVVINVVRDGLANLFKPQPPVAS